MLKERELTLQRHRELEPTLNVDAVIVGSGIMGLMIAKRLADLGQQVAVLEPQPTFAYGASIKNHGWLHRGTAHSISIRDKAEAKRVVGKLVYGYEFFASYASECIEDPLTPIFTLTESAELAQQAVEIWDELEIDNRQVGRHEFLEHDPLISRESKFYIFETEDLQINNRMLFKKLLSDIGKSGGIILKDVKYEYESEEGMNVQALNSNYRLNADTFIYATGANINSQFQKLTGSNIDISYWKSHLIYLPRFNPYSIFSLDRDLPIIINHHETSVINRAYDEEVTEELNYEVDQRQIELAFESVCRLYPSLIDLREQVRGIACIKPSIKFNGQGRHSVNSQIFEPLTNHYFVLPGKMTETPYVADELLHRIYNKLDLNEVSKRPIDLFEESSDKLIGIDSFPQSKYL